MLRQQLQSLQENHRYKNKTFYAKTWQTENLNWLAFYTDPQVLNICII